MQGVENSQFVYAPASETTLLHRGARKADGSEKPTVAGQHDIKLQEAAVRAQLGDASWRSGRRRWSSFGPGPPDVQKFLWPWAAGCSSLKISHEQERAFPD